MTSAPGHSSSGETLCGRVLGALKSEALLNESVGAAYLERSWPPALKESAAWPLVSLRQSFLNGSLTRLVDPDAILKTKIVEFVDRGDFGLASGRDQDGNYERVWFEELVSPDDVAFDAGVFLLRKDSAKALKGGPSPEPAPVPSPQPSTGPVTQPQPPVDPEPDVRFWRLHDDLAPCRNGAARDLEPPGDQDPSKVANWC